ncbi:hypothetical protein SAMN04488587_2247 [Methanococcoides vulcani]|uniref:Uncharacterized protein n=1 Tax=Methanococcoides vulcani TaxID=1353158 RepID=A0A1I0BNC1_9EURY|nr:hypothetical protein SAMN04488587_2247 [Methanococcoides vulcani]
MFILSLRLLFLSGCNNIIEDQVIETVVNKRLDNMKDIIVSINGKI